MLLTSTVFNDINCTPSATSTSVRGIQHILARRRWLYVVSTPVHGIRLLSATCQQHEPLRLQWRSIRGLDNNIAPNDPQNNKRLTNIITTIQPPCDSTGRDMQDYDFNAKFESLPDSTNRLDTRGLLTRVWPLGASCLAYPLSATEEAYSKDTWSPQGPTRQLGVEVKKTLVNLMGCIYKATKGPPLETSHTD
jgi:hypothetical protein